MLNFNAIGKLDYLARHRVNLPTMAVGLSFVVRGYAVYMMVVLFLIIIIILVPEWWGIGWYYRNLNKLLKYTATKTRNIYKRRASLCRSDNF